MKSIRLSPTIEKEIKLIAELEQISESDVIREAIVEYISTKKTQLSSYEIGKSFFEEDRLESQPANDVQSNLSETYKNHLKELIHAKITR
ncbi:hypothetical protein EP331_01575 [bacterium]|nr:MAG: hypothetical protein EP331_01575 [bacterium]